MSPMPEAGGGFDDARREDVLYRQLAWALGLEFVDLRLFPISGGTLRKVPLSVARSRRWVPLVFNRRRVILAVDDPFTAAVVEPGAVESLLDLPPGREIRFTLGAPSALDDVLARRESIG